MDLRNDGAPHDAKEIHKDAKPMILWEFQCVTDVYGQDAIVLQSYLCQLPCQGQRNEAYDLHSDEKTLLYLDSNIHAISTPWTEV